MSALRALPAAKWRIHHRSPLLYGCCAVALVASFVEYAADSASAADWHVAVASIAGGTSYFSVITPPLIAAALARRTDEVEVGRDLHLAGVSAPRWRCADFLATLLLSVVVTVLAAVAALGWRALRAPAGTVDASPDVASTVLLWLVFLTVLSLFSCGVMARRREATVLITGIVIPLAHIGLLSAQSELPVLVDLYPSVAARTLAQGLASSTRTDGLVSLASVLGWSVWGCWRLCGPFTAPTRRRRSRQSPTRGPFAGDRARLVSAALASCAVAVVGGAVVPTALTTGLPWQVRPSYLLQRAHHVGPEDAAATFFDAVWSGRTRQARRMASSAVSVPALGQGDGRLLLRPASSRFFVTSMPALDEATVQLDTDSSSLALCMTRTAARGDGARWEVGRTSETGVCSW